MSTINKPYVALRGTAHADGTVTSFELTWGNARDGEKLVEISRQNSAHERKLLLREVVAP